MSNAAEDASRSNQAEAAPGRSNRQMLRAPHCKLRPRLTTSTTCEYYYYYYYYYYYRHHYYYNYYYYY